MYFVFLSMSGIGIQSGIFLRLVLTVPITHIGPNNVLYIYI